MDKPPLFGVMAEFESPEQVLMAARRVHESGYRDVDAYTPFPVDGLSEAIGIRATRLQRIVFAAGILGAVTGYFMCYYLLGFDYPLNVGGRPLNSWPAFIPITFEVTILFAAFAAVIAMLALNGLPRPHHPVFNVTEFEKATRDRFFLCIEACDPQFDVGKVKEFFSSLQPLSITEVEL